MRLPLLLLAGLAATVATATSRTLDGFTMMIATHNRTQLLPPLLQHLTTDPPPSLRQILLVWQNVGSPLPDFLLPAQLALDYAVPIHVRVSDRNSMNERFRPELDWGNQLETRDVMIMDDDVVLRRGALEWGYQEFLRYNLPGSASSEGRIVGFTARDFRTGERGWEYVVQPQESYSLVLSNSAWLRREWLAAYWAQTEVMAELRDFVDEVFNCDDILINYIVSNLTHNPPLLLQPTKPLRTVPSVGLWNRAEATPATSTRLFASPSPPIRDDNPAIPKKKKPLDHFETRAVCLDRYFTTFARWSGDSDSSSSYPLVKSYTSASQDVVDRARWLSPLEEWEEPIWVMIEEPVAQDYDYIAAMTDEEFEEWERLQPDEYFENAVHDEL